MIASKDFFERSTRVLDEADSNFRPREGMLTGARQVAHAAQTLDWFIEGASRPEGFNLDFESLAKELESAASLTEARGMMATEEFAQPLPAGPVMGGQPISDIVLAMVEHTAHHPAAL